MRMQDRIFITPEFAQRHLDITIAAHANRNIRHGHVQYLAKVFETGAWDGRVAGPIILGKDGVIINGQHRLAAIVFGGNGVLMDVVTDDSLTTA